MVESFQVPAQAEVVGTVGAEVSLVLQNVGNADAGQFAVGVYLSMDEDITTEDRLFWNGEVSVDGLEAGASLVVPIPSAMMVPIDIAPNLYYIGAYVDHQDTITETDETNNVSMGKCNPESITTKGRSGKSNLVQMD